MNEDTYTVQLMDMNEELHSYEKSAIKDYKVQKISKMPSYRDSLNAEQVADLLTFLASLRPE